MSSSPDTEGSALSHGRASQKKKERERERGSVCVCLLVSLLSAMKIHNTELPFKHVTHTVSHTHTNTHTVEAKEESRPLRGVVSLSTSMCLPQFQLHHSGLCVSCGSQLSFSLSCVRPTILGCAAAAACASAAFLCSVCK